MPGAFSWWPSSRFRLHVRHSRAWCPSHCDTEAAHGRLTTCGWDVDAYEREEVREPEDRWWSGRIRPPSGGTATMSPMPPWCRRQFERDCLHLPVCSLIFRRTDRRVISASLNPQLMNPASPPPFTLESGSLFSSSATLMNTLVSIDTRHGRVFVFDQAGDVKRV